MLCLRAFALKIFSPASHAQISFKLRMQLDNDQVMSKGKQIGGSPSSF